MTEMIKVTKRDYFVAIRAMVEQMDAVGEYSADEVLAFLDKQVAQLDAKAAKAREKAGEKKATGDELREKVLAVITDELQTADAITALVAEDGVTKSKVVARLTQLCKTGEIVKDQIKVESRKIMAYRLAD